MAQMIRLSLIAVSLGAVVGCGEVSTAIDASGAVDAPGNDGATTDAPAIDAPIDGPPATPFDVAYTSIWDIKGTTGVGAGGTGVIINRGNQPLDLSQLQVVDFTDDHPVINFTYLIGNPATYLLPPNNSGGSLSPLAGQFIDPMVPEFRFDSSRPTLDFTLNNIPSPIPTVTVNASAHLRIGNQTAQVVMRFNIAASPSSITIISAARVSSVPN